ncbi:DMT family transporter [Microvirga pudoricolor]|uniref:DMT family transporter n=1 Tax=Microvirga pudoricolor TaxID=2778729 RepID=UPI0019527A1B|nr:DMT family transporter [Microvirga pudoricolor]MBM6593523.1 DMT family transporter [Microvirga pudoricolor]
MNSLYLWVPITLIAAAAQTGRNATQRRLTEMIGTVGATQVRFLYGFPFALLALIFVWIVTGERIPGPSGAFLISVAAGAAVQILATALMLAAMRERAFSVVTAYTKTEPVQVALFGLVLLGDTLTPMIGLAILIATAGVVLMSVKPGTNLASAGWKPVVFGIGSGAFFALAAIGFRGAILSLEDGSYLVRATTTLAWSLGVQTLILVAWLGLFDRPALLASFRVWRTSLGAGFLGALASQFWFLGFALTTAANVRTLALVEVLMAQAVSHRFMAQRTTRREILGMALILGGVGLLLFTQR